jgi:hypothetical protein
MKAANLTEAEQTALMEEYMGLKVLHRQLASELGTSISH